MSMGVGLQLTGLRRSGPLPPVPINTVLPVASGTLSVGATLTTTNGTWLNTPTSYAYQWYQAFTDGGGAVITDGAGRPLGLPISGATSQTYVVQAGDATEYLFAEVTATNAFGSTSVSGDAIGPIPGGGIGNRRIVSAGNYRLVSTGNNRKVS